MTIAEDCIASAAMLIHDAYSQIKYTEAVMKKFAILGAGRIGQVHARAISANENASLVAIADPQAAVAQAIADR